MRSMLCKFKVKECRKKVGKGRSSVLCCLKKGVVRTKREAQTVGRMKIRRGKSRKTGTTTESNKQVRGT